MMSASYGNNTSAYHVNSYNGKVKVGDGRETFYQGITWENVLLLEREWVNRVRGQSAWADSEQAKDAFTAAQDEKTGNSPFTQDEQRQITAQLQDVKRYLTEELNLPDDRIGKIEEELDEVAEAGKRMGRKDWIVYLLGTITALVITATVAAPVGEHIFTMVIHGLAHLFTGRNGPPPIPAPPIA